MINTIRLLRLSESARKIELAAMRRDCPDKYRIYVLMGGLMLGALIGPIPSILIGFSLLALYHFSALTLLWVLIVAYLPFPLGFACLLIIRVEQQNRRKEEALPPRSAGTAAPSDEGGFWPG